MKIFKFDTLPNILFGILSGTIILVKDICTIKTGKIEVRGSELYVDDIFVSNLLGTVRSRALFEKEGLAVVIQPKESIFRVTLENYGQRQAMLFEVVRALGVKRYKFTRREFAKGRIVIALVPIINDIERFKEVVLQTPILENSRKIHRIMKSGIIGGGEDE